MKHFLITMTLCAAVFGTAMAAPLDSYAGSPQARDALADLTARGLIRAYPDGNYKGDRAITRYEVVQLLDRTQRLMEGQDASLAPKSELDALNQEVNSLDTQLQNLDGRVDAVEPRAGRQDP